MMWTTRCHVISDSAARVLSREAQSRCRAGTGQAWTGWPVSTAAR